MKKIIFSGLVLLLIGAVFLSGCNRSGGTRRMRFATGGATGTYYPFGGAIAQILNENTNADITVQTSGASGANMQLLEAEEVEMAIVQTDVMDYAWRGVESFSSPIRNFAAVVTLYAELVQIVTTPASGISSVTDLRGKNVSVGDAGSGVEFNARQIFEVHGMSFDDIAVQNLSFAASADALRDGKIDAFFCTAGVPTPAVVDLATNRDIVIVPIDQAQANQLISRFPYYAYLPVPAGAYRGVSAPVMTVGINSALVISNSISEDLVYDMTKALFENQAELASIHAKGAELSPVSAVQGMGSVPFHPGAEKYLKEIGALR